MHIVLVGLHWGDEGKGKVVDYLSDQMDIVVRFQGGSNAGHTLKVNDQVYKLSLIPSGVVRGKPCLIDRGVVFDSSKFLEEVKNLKEVGIDAKKLVKVCSSVFLVLSLHKDAESCSSATAAIGTTRRGIGPAYEDKIGRRGVRLQDSGANLKDRVKLLAEHHNAFRKGKGLKLLSESGILEEIENVSHAMKGYLVESNEIGTRYKGHKILFEGSQGILLDVDHGTYPYVTSSNTLPAQVMIGSSFELRRNQLFHLGVMKSYMTRVGEGPFPTQAAGEEAKILHSKGKEIGTITDRARRCGWLDIPLSRKSIRAGQIDGLALTKLDVLDHFQTVKICVEYREGKPVYEELPGWSGERVKGKTHLNQLPKNSRRYLDRIKELLGVEIYLVSTGPERDEMISATDVFS